jgi:SAM-dependent methyltransferase
MPNEEKYIFTEGINYQQTGENSIWGKGDNKTLEVMLETPFKGKWLNLAAGDGRYNVLLLEKADSVVAVDIDQGALTKLRENTPPNLQNKLNTRQLNIHEPLPFGDQSFDGVFCTGTLYLFPKPYLEKIFEEIDRILRNDGRLFLDFATDVKRVWPNGQLKTKKSEASYTLEEAKQLLKSLTADFATDITESEVPEEKLKVGDLTYTFSCNFLLLTGKKLRSDL